MTSTVHSTNRFDVHATITNTIIAAIERGVDEFVMPWHRQGGFGRPANAATSRLYRGVNVLALWATAMTKGFSSNHWATYRQWTTLGAHVQKGAKGTPILFYKPLTPGDERDESQSPSRFIARASCVFNGDQVDGWKAECVDQADELIRIEAAECLVTSSGAEVRHVGDNAFYSAVHDYVQMPTAERFVGSPTRSAGEAYYAVLLHELVHWTGGEHRLQRTFGERFGDHAYAFEELVAELGSAFLCADLGIATEPRPDHASYIAHWLTVLSSDKRAIVTASRLATEAAGFLAKAT